jgi:hypothetical protein
MDLIRIGLVAWLIAALLGCSTTRAMTSVTPERARAELQVGDRVRLTTLSGQRWELKLSAVSETQLSGVTPRGQTLSFHYVDLQSVESTRFSPEKTAGAIGAVAVIYVVLAAAFAAALAKAFADGFSPN